MTTTLSLKISDLEKRIKVLETQLKREINCSYCQKNRFIQKWLDESTSSESSESSKTSEQLKKASLKRKREKVDEDDTSINVHVCHSKTIELE